MSCCDRRAQTTLDCNKNNKVQGSEAAVQYAQGPEESLQAVQYAQGLEGQLSDQAVCSLPGFLLNF